MFPFLPHCRMCSYAFYLLVYLKQICLQNSTTIAALAKISRIDQSYKWISHVICSLDQVEILLIKVRMCFLESVAIQFLDWAAENAWLNSCVDTCLNFFPSVLSFLRFGKRTEGKLAWIYSPILNFIPGFLDLWNIQWIWEQFLQHLDKHFPLRAVLYHHWVHKAESRERETGSPLGCHSCLIEWEYSSL